MSKLDRRQYPQFAHGHTPYLPGECRTLCQGCQRTFMSAELGVLLPLCEACRPRFVQLTADGLTQEQALAELHKHPDILLWLNAPTDQAAIARLFAHVAGVNADRRALLESINRPVESLTYTGAASMGINGYRFACPSWPLYDSFIKALGTGWYRVAYAKPQ